MATYLLDTTAFSLLVRRDAAVQAQIASLAATDTLVLCSIVRGEVLYGLERMADGRRRRDLETKIGTLFAAIPCEPVPEAAADHYARIKRTAERTGTRLDENDLWIAATALALDAILVTRDSDFQRLDGLRSADWAG